MISLNDKITYSNAIIEKYIHSYAVPALLISFGKDSMVLLHLMKSLNKKMPCIYYREPFFPNKTSFANKIINDWNLTVFDYAPTLISLFEDTDFNQKQVISFLNFIHINSIHFSIETKSYEPDFSQPYLCGLFDVINKAKSDIMYKYDCIFVASKDCDKDSSFRFIDFENPDHATSKEDPDVITPLKHWSDDDIWSYIKLYNIPFDEKRYSANFLENLDCNSTFYPICTKCIDKRNDNFVYCPRFDLEIPNIHLKENSLNYFNVRPKIYFYGTSNRYNKIRKIKIDTDTHNGFLNSMLKNLQASLKENPNDPETYTRLCVIFQEQHNFKKAFECIYKALEINPNDGNAKYHLASLLLLTGDLENGWKYYEERINQSIMEPKNIQQFDHPKWKGEDLKGKTIYVHPEQGLGDNIQFARFVPLLSQMGANVIFKAADTLYKLFKQSNLKAKIIAESEINTTNIKFDTHISVMSLPYYLKINQENMPFKDKYLKADPVKVDLLKQKFFNNKDYKIGLVWTCKNVYKKDSYRSIPNVEYLYPLAKLKGIKLYSLQQGNAELELKSLPPDINITDVGIHFKTFDDTAAAIENLDLVITVDTSVAHVSAALGKKTWILLEFASDWRWLTNTDKSYWYNSVKLFRQKEFCDWNGVIEEVVSELKNIL